MERYASGIDSSNSGRSQDDELLLCMLTDIFKEGRFPRSSFPGQENRLAGTGYQLQGILELLIIGV